MQYFNPGILDGSVTTAKLADAAVTTAKLATVNTNVGSFNATDVTVNAQGQVTAAASGAGNATQTTVASPGGITSGSKKMLGLGATITPVKSGKVQVVITGAQTNGSGPSTVQIAYGTGSPPANGAAATGTAIGGAPAYNNDQEAATDPLALAATISGLTLSTEYWVDLQCLASAGTTTFTGVSVVLEEV